MMPEHLASRLLTFLLLLLLLAAAAGFSLRVAAEYRGGLPVDMLIFRKAALDFWETGELYDRPEDVPREKYHIHPYEPGAPIYKFPPVFQLGLAPWFRDGKAPGFFPALRSVMVGAYLLTIVLVVSVLARQFFLPVNPADKKVFLRRRYFVMSAVLACCLFYPFFNAYQALVAEIPLLLLLLLFFLLSRSLPLISGFLLAWCALVKIYPAFMGVILLYQRNFKAMVAAAVSSMLIVLFCVYYFGLDENLFYLREILPGLLGEPVILENKNLSLESWLVFHGFRQNLTGELFQLVRVLALGVFFYTLIRLPRNDNAALYLFLLCLCLLLLCLPNYWVQYQLFLLLPFLYLLAYALASGQSGLLVLLLLCFTVFVPDETWYGYLAAYSMSGVDVDAAELYALAAEKGQAWLFWQYSKPALLVYAVVECRVFMPFVFFFLLLFLRRQLLDFPPPLADRVN